MLRKQIDFPFRASPIFLFAYHSIISLFMTKLAQGKAGRFRSGGSVEQWLGWIRGGVYTLELFGFLQDQIFQQKNSHFEWEKRSETIQNEMW